MAATKMKTKIDLRPHCGCPYCTDEEHCNVWVDGLTNEWYLELPTGEFDPNNDYAPIMVRSYNISHCPYCGRRLE